MNAIGFRAEANGMNWCVVNGPTDKPNLVEWDFINAPKISAEAAVLAYFRDKIFGVVKRLKTTVAMVRYPEPSRQKSNSVKSADERSRIEGVLLEALHTSGVKVCTGALVTIGSKLGAEEPKVYLQRDEIRGIRYPKKAIPCRESFMAAVAALESGDDHGSPRADEVPED